MTRLLPRLTFLLIVSALTSPLPTQAATLSGLVADEGEPVANAELLLVNAENNVLMKSAFTDSEGRFQFTVKPGRFNIGTFKPDHSTLWSNDVVVQDADVSILIELTPNAFSDAPSSSPEEDCE